MAEVLGIVAGVAQLLDHSTRILVASSSLYSKLKNIPDEIDTLKKNTQLFTDLLWMISSDFDGPINSQVHSLHVTHRVTSILHDMMKESEDLALLLEGLSAKNSSPMRRQWSAVVSATKEKEITERCCRIESFKSTLQLWYQHQSNARLRRVEQQLSQITISQNATQMSMGLLAQKSSTVIDSNRAIARRIDSYGDPAPSPDGPLRHRRRRLQRNGGFCACRPSGSSAYLSIYGLQLFYSQESSHSPNCPYQGVSTSWSCGVRALSPKIQMMVGIQLGGWSLSMVGRLSPHNVVDDEKSPAFIALDEALGALRAVKSRAPKLTPEIEPSWEYRVDRLRLSHTGPVSTSLTVQEEAKSLFYMLLQKLREAFESGTASPSDHTPDNQTLLHRFVIIAMQCVGLHEVLFHILDDIVKLLAAGNADPNACTYYAMAFRTPICYMSLYLKSNVHHQHNHLDRILINHGCNAFHILQGVSQPRLVGLFKKNPTLLEDHDQYPAYVATIQRSEERLRLLLMQNKIDLKTKAPSILSLAVGWTAGLQILLDAGANPEDAIFTALWEYHLPSIELLIDNGCSLFDLDRYNFFNVARKFDLLFFAAEFPASSDMVCLLVQKLVERRLELQQLAWRELPETCLRSLGLHQHHHSPLSPDYNALEVFRQLEAHKVQVPRSLWPGSLTTLYHHRGMTDTLAERLYDAGFCNINELDEKGHSPLINQILYRDSRLSSRLAQWYLRKGSRLPRSFAYVDFLDRARKFIGLVSARVWVTKDSRFFGHLKMFQELHPEGVEQRDSCNCWCSASGCTPVGMVLRRSFNPSVSSKFTHRQRWLFNLARYSSLGLSLDRDTFADICRLEVFDRLGMAHTCSHYHCDSYDGDDNSSERNEIQEEDHCLKQALDSYLTLYLSLLHSHTERFESFWIAWWTALDKFLPFELEDGDPYHPPELDSVGDPQSYDNAQSRDGYEPNVEAITDCVTQLNPEKRAEFLGQFELPEHELNFYRRRLDYDSSVDDTDGRGDGSG